MDSDPTLFCVSAYNDLGQAQHVSDPTALFRSDFFPGLGWMLSRKMWEDEFSSKWPAAYWDEWMRDNKNRKHRSCIRPEVSRSKTFGSEGVSAGQFFR